MDNLNQELVFQVEAVPQDTPVVETLAQMERRAIENALVLAKGNKTKVSEMLGISIKTVYNKLHEYGLSEFVRTKKDSDEAN